MSEAFDLAMNGLAVAGASFVAGLFFAVGGWVASLFMLPATAFFIYAIWWRVRRLERPTPTGATP